MNSKNKFLVIVILLTLVIGAYYYSIGVIDILIFSGDSQRVVITNKSEVELINSAIKFMGKGENVKSNAIGDYIIANSMANTAQNVLGYLCKAIAYNGINNYSTSLELLLDNIESIENHKNSILKSEYYFLIARNIQALGYYSDEDRSVEEEIWIRKAINTRLEAELTVEEAQGLTDMYTDLMYINYFSGNLNAMEDIFNDSRSNHCFTSTQMLYEILYGLAIDMDTTQLEDKVYQAGFDNAPQHLYALIEIALKLEDASKALELINHLDEKYGSSDSIKFFVQYYSGRYHQMLNEIQESTEFYLKALDLSPRSIRRYPMKKIVETQNLDVEKYKLILNKEYSVYSNETFN